MWERGQSTTPAAVSSWYPPTPGLGEGAALVPLTWDRAAMVQVRGHTCPKSPGKWHLQKHYPGVWTPWLILVHLSPKPETSPKTLPSRALATWLGGPTPRTRWGGAKVWAQEYRDLASSLMPASTPPPELWGLAFLPSLPLPPLCPAEGQPGVLAGKLELPGEGSRWGGGGGGYCRAGAPAGNQTATAGSLRLLRCRVHR